MIAAVRPAAALADTLRAAAPPAIVALAVTTPAALSTRAVQLLSAMPNP